MLENHENEGPLSAKSGRSQRVETLPKWAEFLLFANVRFWPKADIEIPENHAKQRPLYPRKRTLRYYRRLGPLTTQSGHARLLEIPQLC